MLQLPWQMVQGRIKETEGSGHAKMDIFIRQKNSSEGCGPGQNPNDTIPPRPVEMCWQERHRISKKFSSGSYAARFGLVSNQEDGMIRAKATELSGDA